jgi:hypothetical protein
MNDGFCQAKSLIGLALTWHELGDQPRARTVGDQGLALLRDAGVKGELAPRLDLLGRAALGHGDLTRAADLFNVSVCPSVRINSPFWRHSPRRQIVGHGLVALAPFRPLGGSSPPSFHHRHDHAVLVPVGDQHRAAIPAATVL